MRERLRALSRDPRHARQRRRSGRTSRISRAGGRSRPARSTITSARSPAGSRPADVKPGNRMPPLPRSPARTCARSPLTWRASIERRRTACERRGAAAAEPAAAPGGRARRGSTRVWQPPRGWRVLTAVNNTHIGLWYVGDGAALPRPGAACSRCSCARSSRCPRTTSSSYEPYNQLFTMHGTVMMFLFAVPGRRGDRRAAAARHARRARPAVPAAVGVRVLGVRDRRRSSSSARSSSASRRTAAGSCTRR